MIFFFFFFFLADDRDNSLVHFTYICLSHVFFYDWIRANGPFLSFVLSLDKKKEEDFRCLFTDFLFFGKSVDLCFGFFFLGKLVAF